MTILDTSGLLAAINSKQRLHKEAAEALRKARTPLLMSPFVLAELDYLFSSHIGRKAELDLLNEVERGVYRLEHFNQNDIKQANEVLLQYTDLDLGLADASLVVLANRYKTHDILTLDQRHFRAVRGPGNKPFRLLPADL